MCSPSCGGRVTVTGEQPVDGVTAIAQNSDPFTYFSTKPVYVNEGVAIDDGTLSMAVLKRAAVRDMPTLMPRLFSQNCRDQARLRLGLEGLLAGGHFVKRGAEGKNIAAGIGFAAIELLGRHVLKRADDGSLRGKRRVLGASQQRLAHGR